VPSEGNNAPRKGLTKDSHDNSMTPPRKGRITVAVQFPDKASQKNWYGFYEKNS
jgi:hypothetical protein